MAIDNDIDSSAAMFDAEDLRALAEARIESEAEDALILAEAGEEQTGAPAPAPAPTPSAPAPEPAFAPAPAPAAPSPAPAAPTPAPAAPAPAAPAPAEVPHHLHAALRVERARADRLAAENESLKKAVPAPPAASVPDAQALKDVADFDPTVAAYYTELEKQNKELAARAAPAPRTQEFEPERFPAAVQEVVDAIPALFAMQINPDQTAFNLAKKADGFLQADPAWKDKPEAERFAEAARIASERIGKPAQAPSPTPTPPANPQEAARLAALAKVQAATGDPHLAIGDLRGGARPTNDEPDYSRMSDADVMADLARHG